MPSLFLAGFPTRTQLLNLPGGGSDLIGSTPLTNAARTDAGEHPMGMFDNIKGAAKKGTEKAKSVSSARFEEQEEKRAALREQGVLLQLKSLEGTVELYDDRVEITNLLKSKHRVIPYSQIHAVNLEKTSDFTKVTAAVTTLGASLVATNKKRLVINAGLETVGLEFRVESVDRIRAAMAIINERIRQGSQGGQPTITVNNVAPSTLGQSIADELTKLAKLKADGVLSESEFEAQKQRLLIGG
jgi:hypothetical protein